MDMPAMGQLICASLWAAAVTVSAAPASSPEQLEFFENNVRPLFAEHCYNCHSEKAEKIKGGLRLDTSDGLVKGGSSGSAIAPGNPDMSLLIKAVRYTDPDLQMPPKDQKLSDKQIATLEAWVKMGAPVPASSGPRPLTDINEARKRHWAFQPVTKPALPAVKRASWIRTPVDNFVLANLEKKGLKPAPTADRRTLIRRATYDLTGLPPTFQEVEAFINDKRPDAYERVVDRLLASPHYGERWGRYWLDVARYADTKGYLAGGEERRYMFSYTYRDYVVRAFKEDKPYDQFIVEQIAADRLSLGEDKRALAALGFLTLGRRFLNNREDIIDDRIDVVARGTLGLTVGCARCHDHKFDPIPTKDYYAWHGIFASSEEPGELPLLVPLRDSPEYQGYLKEKGKIEAEIEGFKERESAQFIDELRQQIGDYLLGARDAARLEDKSTFDTFAGERKLNPVVLRRWMNELEARGKKSDPIFAPWFDSARADLATNQAVAANPVVTKALAARTTNSLPETAAAYTKLFKEVDAEWKAALAAATKEKKPVPTALPDADHEAVRQVLYAKDSAVNLPRAEAEEILSRKISEGIAPMRNRIQALSWTHPGAPQRAMALVDRPNPGNSRVSIRGNAGNPGEEAPRGFLQVLSAANCTAFTNGSGRLELARAIASPQNPLTARVYVNRVWLHHFGQPLVGTPGDFGVRTPEPVERGLLDYLAAAFVENGWSTKALHRAILLSATYQQSSDAPASSRKADPDNRLLSRMNRQPLDFEALRDTLLAAAGKLDLSVGGLPVDLLAEPFSGRRTVYGFIDRQNLPGVFRTFDFANPDTSNQGRFHTTVPQQALFLMNSPFVIQQAWALSERGEIKSASNAEAKIQALYHLIFQRPAGRAEMRLAADFLDTQPKKADHGPPGLQKLAQVLLLSNEALFVD
jgi:mono/diheme cytochrome c family protein